MDRKMNKRDDSKETGDDKPGTSVTIPPQKERKRKSDELQDAAETPVLEDEASQGNPSKEIILGSGPTLERKPYYKKQVKMQLEDEASQGNPSKEIAKIFGLTLERKPYYKRQGKMQEAELGATAREPDYDGLSDEDIDDDPDSEDPEGESGWYQEEYDSPPRHRKGGHKRGDKSYRDIMQKGPHHPLK